MRRAPTQTGATPARRLWAHAALVVGLLAVLIGLALWAAVTSSPAADEPAYIASGLAILRTGDFRLSYHQAPLMETLCGAAVLDAAPPLPLESRFWHTPRPYAFGIHFWSTLSSRQAEAILIRSRLPALAIAVGLALLVVLWARQLYGWPAAGLALVLYCFNPNILAHSGIAGNDLALAAAITFCVYSWWRYLRSPCLGRLALVGLAVGLALLVKQSALLLILLLPVLAGCDRLAGRAGSGSGSRLGAGALLWRMAAILAVAALVVTAGYGFQLQTVGFANRPVDERPPNALRLPAGQFINGIISQAWHQRLGHSAYLLGRTYEHGRWYYIPVALAVKTPLPLLALLGIALGLRRFRRDELFLAVPAAAFFLAAVFQHINIGLRYILVVYPLLAVFAARAVARPWPAPRPRVGWVTVGALAGWMMAEALLYAPQYLAYFNELAGGPAGGHRVLADSNIDWGQDLERLAAWQRQHPVTPLYFAYFGSGNPRHYGIQAVPLPGHCSFWPGAAMPEAWYRSASQPRSGWIAISVNCLRLDLKALTGAEISYAWLRNYEPVDRAGYSILIYHIAHRPG